MSVDPLVLIILIVALGPVLYFAANSMRRERRATKHLNVSWLDTLNRPVHRSDGWDSLTAREVEIVERLADGKHNAEIARELYLSTATVARHIQNIYRKLGVRNRVELIRALHEHER